MTSLRRGCPSHVWCCSVNMIQCFAGVVTATTHCTRAWWRCSSQTYWDLFPVSSRMIPQYRFTYNSMCQSWWWSSAESHFARSGLFLLTLTFANLDVGRHSGCWGTNLGRIIHCHTTSYILLKYHIFINHITSYLNSFSRCLNASHPKLCEKSWELAD